MFKINQCNIYLHLAAVILTNTAQLGTTSQLLLCDERQSHHKRLIIAVIRYKLLSHIILVVV